MKGTTDYISKLHDDAFEESVRLLLRLDEFQQLTARRIARRAYSRRRISDPDLILIEMDVFQEAVSSVALRLGVKRSDLGAFRCGWRSASNDLPEFVRLWRKRGKGDVLDFGREVARNYPHYSPRILAAEEAEGGPIAIESDVPSPCFRIQY